MKRIVYQPTPEQRAKWTPAPPMPTDDELWDMMERERSRKPFSLYKRDYVANMFKNTEQYQRGLWQGRLDQALGLPYTSERPNNIYNIAYYRGYTNYESDRRGWDEETKRWFDSVTGRKDPAEEIREFRAANPHLFGAQLWQRCRCGREPVYAPTMRCVRCLMQGAHRPKLDDSEPTYTHEPDEATNE